jgi:hypothetical protein
MGRGLPREDLATRTFILAAVHQLKKEIRASQNAYNEFRNVIADLASRLDENFSLSSEQKVFHIDVMVSDASPIQMNVRTVLADGMYDPNRICFMQLHIDMEVCIMCVSTICFFDPCLEAEDSPRSEQSQTHSYLRHTHSREGPVRLHQNNLLKSSEFPARNGE